MSEELVPPNDLAAEQSVLGALMLSSSTIWDVAGTVTADDFYQPKHQHIFEAILALNSNNEPMDVIAVSDHLQKVGKLGLAGGPEYLHTLTSFVPSIASAGYYAGIVSEKALLRRLVVAGQRITQMGFRSEGDADDLVEQARFELNRVGRNTKADIVNVGPSFDRVVDATQETVKAAPSPWSKLDELIVGLMPGKMYVIGGRPGDGKTIMGLQLARAMCATGNVALTTMEMQQDEITQRLIASMADVDYGALVRHQLTAEEWDRVRVARPRIANMPLFVDDRSDMTITKIKAFARSVARKGPLGGVVVDYLQLISGTGQRQTRYEIVSEVARQLKNMAKELGCPVVALSQLGRGDSGGRGKGGVREPILSDLKESGEIEQAADVVMLLHRPLDEGGKVGNDLMLIVAKNRSGRTGVRWLRWEARFSRVVAPESVPKWEPKEEK